MPSMKALEEEEQPEFFLRINEGEALFMALPSMFL
jgi:hypothetical protein